MKTAKFEVAGLVYSTEPERKLANNYNYELTRENTDKLENRINSPVIYLSSCIASKHIISPLLVNVGGIISPAPPRVCTLSAINSASYRLNVELPVAL